MIGPDHTAIDRRAFLSGLFIFCSGVAAGRDGPAADILPPVQARTWTVEGVERTALVHMPGGLTTTAAPRPVVFVFHGHGGTSRSASRSFHLHQLWPEAIVVYPQGLPTPGALTDPEGQRAGWQSRPGMKDDRDFKFFDAMLVSLKKEAPVDDRRVYATGHSNGGGFTYLLAVARPGVFAAIAPSSAIAVPGRWAGLGAPRPIPVLHIAGRNDPLVKFAWQESTMAGVRKLNGCETEGKPWEGGKGARVYHSSGGTPLVTYIHDGDHKFAPDAPALIVKFFQQHPRGRE